MVELDQFKYTLSTYDETLKEVKDSLDLENKERRITELDKSMEEPGFWDDPERSTKTVREAKNLKDTVDGYKHLEQQYEDIQVMIEMGYEENDPAMIPEIQEMLDEVVRQRAGRTPHKDTPVRRVRRLQRDPQAERGRGWYRGDGLVQYAVSYVPALGGQKGLYDRGA